MLDNPNIPRLLDQEQGHNRKEEQGQTPTPLPSTGPALERYRHQIEQFDADREAPIGKIIRVSLLAIAYIAPPLCAIILGWEFGQAFGQGDVFLSLAMHILSVTIELIIAGLALGTAHSVKRMASNRKQLLPRAMLCGFLFGIASLGSALALWWVLSRVQIPAVVLVFRVIMPVLIEVGAMAVIATLDFQSLEAFLSSLHQRAEAIQRLSEAELRLAAAEQEAVNRQREYEEYRAMRARNEEVLIKMLEIQSRGALAAMERQVRVIESEAERPALPPAAPKFTEDSSWSSLFSTRNGHQARGGLL